VPDPEQRKILDDLVAERAGADDQHARPREAGLVPPADQLEAREAVLLRRGGVGGQLTRRNAQDVGHR
jgi:hypothetical protein